MVHFPQDLPLPISLKRGATHVGRTANEALIRDLAVVEKRTAVGEIAVAGRVGHIPAMDNISLKIDEEDGLVGVC